MQIPPNGSPDASPTSGDDTVGGSEADATFEYQATLNFDTSFRQEDLLRLSLAAGDPTTTLANTENGLAVSDGGTDSNVELNGVFYSFPVSRKINATIAANSLATGSFVSSTIVAFDGPSVADAGGPEFYDLYNGGNSFSAGLNIDISENVVLDLAYASDTGNVNESDEGLFNNYSYLAQLNWLSDGIFSGAISYVNGDDSPDSPQYTIAGLVSFDFGQVVVSGHYAYTPSTVGGNLNSYTGGLTFPDLFSAGSELGIYGGVSPAVDRNPWIVETYYQIAVNESLLLTPAVVYSNSDGDGRDTENAYGALRATLVF